MIKFLRISGIVLLIIILVPLVAALFIPKEYEVEKTIIIEQPKDTVFQFLVMLKNQDQFSVWSRMDTAMKREYKGTDGTVGFVSAWESLNDNVGTGEQEITEIIPGEKISYTIRFIKPFRSVSDAWIGTEAVSESQTKVHWGFAGKMKYPMNVMLLFMNMEDAVGKDFETGLVNLKALLEKP
jgi:hypothetical protein